MGVNLNVIFKYPETERCIKWKIKRGGVMWVDGVIVARYLYIPATVVYIDG